MEPIRLAVCLMTSGLLLAAHAQPAAGTASNLAEGYLMAGPITQPTQGLSLDDWRRVLPNSQLLMQDVPSENGRSAGRYDEVDDLGRAGALMTYAAVALDLGGNDAAGSKFEKRLRLGLGFLGAESGYGTWRRSKTGHADTLISQSTGELFFLDTTWTERYAVNTSRSRMGLDASFILRRVSASRWAWYVGLGAQLGSTFNGTARVTHTIERTSDDPFNYLDEENTELGNESFRTRSQFWGAAYGTIGLDFRLGRTSPFWSMLHLCYELRPTVLISGQPGLPTRTEGASQSLFGLRFDLR